MNYDQAVRELIAAATEVKYKSQRLKDALAAFDSVPKRGSFSDKPVAWVRYKQGLDRYIDYEPDPKVEGSGWVPLYRHDL